VMTSSVTGMISALSHATMMPLGEVQRIRTKLIHGSSRKNLYEKVEPQSGSRTWFRRAASPTGH
jgi:hypothetical protein